jgi:disulfide bond formation protein DsbB
MVASANTSRRLGQWLALLIPAALLGGAYIAQYGFGLFPCEMCWWQRYPHFAAIPLAALGLITRKVGLSWLAVAALLASGLIGAFHAGVEYHWWEGFTTCSSLVKPGGDPLEAIMNAPVIRCDVAQWTMLGVSLAGFNFLFSTLGAALSAMLLRRSGQPA